jgi:hypothetical protein
MMETSKSNTPTVAEKEKEKEKETTYSHGDFSFIKNVIWRQALSNAYAKIESKNIWALFKETVPDNSGYMFWDHPILSNLSYELDSDGHSGASFAICMRNMEYIAKNGWDSYVIYMKNKK